LSYFFSNGGVSPNRVTLLESESNHEGGVGEMGEHSRGFKNETGRCIKKYFLRKQNAKFFFKKRKDLS
jgi:hypothetical protein